MTLPHDSWAEVYDLVYQEEFGSLYQRLTNLTLNAIKQLVDPPASIIDFGAGTGRLSIPLARAGYHVTAVEPSGPMLRQLRYAAPNDNINCVESSMQDFCSAQSFDLAICVFTVVIYFLSEEHLHKAMMQAKNCVKPSGLLLLDVPRSEVFNDRHSHTQRMRRDVHMRLVESHIYEYCDEIELFGVGNVKSCFKDRFLIRKWEPRDVIRIAHSCGFYVKENLSEQFSGTGSEYYVLSRRDP